MKPRFEQVNYKNIAGKTIVMSVPYSSDLLLVFTDKTYAYLDIDYGYGDDSPELDTVAAVDLLSYRDEDLLACGMVTQEDIDERDAERKKREDFRKGEQVERELQHYLRLKEKFEGKVS
jgi:hypothetical protein